jgi:hypothetical protein
MCLCVYVCVYVCVWIIALDECHRAKHMKQLCVCLCVCVCDMSACVYVCVWIIALDECHRAKHLNVNMSSIRAHIHARMSRKKTRRVERFASTRKIQARTYAQTHTHTREHEKYKESGAIPALKRQTRTHAHVHTHTHTHEQEKDKESGAIRFSKEKTTKAALFVHELQQALPNARVVYVSATGASGMYVYSYVCMYACMYDLCMSYSELCQMRVCNSQRGRLVHASMYACMHVCITCD